MGIHTGIEWCDSTLNPMMGCDGCELWTPDGRKRTCYAGVQIERYHGLSPNLPKVFTEPQLYTHRFDDLAKWPDLTGKERKDKPWLNGLPRLVFLCDMGDPFTESLPLFWLAPYLPFLGSLPHIIILLTKRPHRMLGFSYEHPFPKNFWLLTSISSRLNATRAGWLMGIDSGGLKGVCYGPALGPLDWHPVMDNLGWFIAEGESGPKCTAPNPDWFQESRDNCAERNIPFFFKQWGGFLPDSQNAAISGPTDPGGAILLGKKKAGRLLDGREYLQMPRVETRAFGMNEQMKRYLANLVHAIADRKNTSMKRDGLIHALRLLYVTFHPEAVPELHHVFLWAEDQLSGTVGEAIAGHLAVAAAAMTAGIL